jgi:hypothetical protein
MTQSARDHMHPDARSPFPTTPSPGRRSSCALPRFGAQLRQDRGVLDLLVAGQQHHLADHLRRRGSSSTSGRNSRPRCCAPTGMMHTALPGRRWTVPDPRWTEYVPSVPGSARGCRSPRRCRTRAARRSPRPAHPASPPSRCSPPGPRRHCARRRRPGDVPRFRLTSRSSSSQLSSSGTSAACARKATPLPLNGRVGSVAATREDADLGPKDRGE